MDALSLLVEARSAGIGVRGEGDRLHVRGSRTAEALARQILALKDEVMALLPKGPCWVCKGKVWWISVRGARACSRCHPPATPALVAIRVVADARGGSRVASPSARREPGTPISHADIPGIIQRLAPGARRLRTYAAGDTIVHEYANLDADRRAWTVKQGETLCWPRLDVGRGESIAQGETAWRLFCVKATEEQIASAIEMLKALDANGDTPGDPA